MFMFPLFNNTDKAFDDYCRRQLKGFSLPPQEPLNLAGVPSPSLPSLRVWLQAHTLPIVATGVTTATVGGILWATLPRQAKPVTTPTDNPVVADTRDSVEEASPTITYSEPETVPKPTTAHATKKANRPKPAAAETTAPQPDTVATAAEPETPVVIKKVHRKRKNTVIVKDNQ